MKIDFYSVLLVVLCAAFIIEVVWWNNGGSESWADQPAVSDGGITLTPRTALAPGDKILSISDDKFNELCSVTVGLDGGNVANGFDKRECIDVLIESLGRQQCHQ